MPPPPPLPPPPPPSDPPLPGDQHSSGLTVYQRPSTSLPEAGRSRRGQAQAAADVRQPTASQPPSLVQEDMDTGDDDVPRHHRLTAAGLTREDEEYNRDVENIAGSSSSSRPRSSTTFGSTTLSSMIRLSAESTAFYQGSGWRSYESYIGAPILYPSYSTEIRQALMTSPRVQSVIRRLAREALVKKGGDRRPPDAPSTAAGDRTRMSRLRQQEAAYVRQLDDEMNKVRRTADMYIDSLVADMSNKTMARFGAFIVNNVLVKMYNQGIHIKMSEFVEVRKAAEEAAEKRQSLLFLPCHKSHVDYVVISYVFYRLGIALPHVAAGDNLNLPFVGWLLKHGGAFFIRRSFGEDPLYQEIVKEYVELLLRRGHNMEVFTEGTRSRTGKLLSPRFGILKMVLDAVLSGRVDDCTIVPMSIGYDKVIETETYVTELMGRPKEKESLKQILNAASILQLKLGRIDIRFARPYSLRAWIADEIVRRSTPGAIFAPMYSPEQKSTLLQSLGFRVLSEINAVSVVMPTALVGTVILTLRGRGVGRTELIRRVTWLRRQILLKGGKVADFGGASTSIIVDRALATLSGLIGARKDLLELVFYAIKRFEISLYRNQAILAASMYATIKKGQTHRRIRKDHLLKDVIFLSQLFKGEFVYRPGTVAENTDLTLVTLHDHNVIDLESERGEPMIIRIKPSPLAPYPDSLTDVRRTVDSNTAFVTTATEDTPLYVKLSNEERSAGREHFDFYCFLIWPFVDTYWLAAMSLFCLLPTPAIGGYTEKNVMEKIQLFGKTLYYEGDLGYFESINKETLKNALYRYQDLGYVRTRKMPVSSGKDKVTTTLLWSLDPVMEEEAMRFWNLPFPADAAYQDTYAFAENSVDNRSVQSTPSNIYETRLWNLQATVAKHRREGKHRRDNKITGQRTLRLAKMTNATAEERALL